MSLPLRDAFVHATNGRLSTSRAAPLRRRPPPSPRFSKTGMTLPNWPVAGSAQLILASASIGRASILSGAGVPFRQQPAAIDERSLEADLASREGCLDAGQLALMLSAAKAEAVSAAEP